MILAYLEVGQILRYYLRTDLRIVEQHLHPTYGN